MKFEIECEREEDGRWLAEVPQLPGVLAYGSSADEAMAKAEILALRVLAERLEHGESRPPDSPGDRSFPKRSSWVVMPAPGRLAPAGNLAAAPDDWRTLRAPRLSAPNDHGYAAANV